MSSLETSGTNYMIGDMMQSISKVVSNVGNAFLESMKAEQEMRLDCSESGCTRWNGLCKGTDGFDDCRNTCQAMSSRTD